MIKYGIPFCGKKSPQKKNRLLLIMKVTTALLLLGCMQISAASLSQTVSLKVREQPLILVFESVEAQTGYRILYSDRLLSTVKPVTISAENMPLEVFLKKVLSPRDMTYTVDDQSIFIRPTGKTHLGNESAVTTSSVLQHRIITGKVTDAKGAPIPGVNVRAKNEGGISITGTTGDYRITLPPHVTELTFSMLGFESRDVVIGNRTSIDMVLHEEASDLDEIVVIGYGTVSKKDLTGAVGQVNVEDMQQAPVGNFAEALAGRVAGVQVLSADGQPGGGMEILIRGVGSLTQSSAPLYVIDGFPDEDLDPSTLNMEEIESLTVLKDASSTAIYGSRAANGVVLIETKKGKAGKSIITLNSSLGYQLETKEVEMMSPYEFVKYHFETFPTIDMYFSTGRTLEDYRDIEGVNWFDHIIKKGAVGNHNIAIRGGNSQTKYAISGGAFDQTGIVVNSGYNRYSGRVTLDHQVNKKLNVGLTSNYSSVMNRGQVVRNLLETTNATNYVMYRAWGYRPVSQDEDFELLEEEADDDVLSSSNLRFNPVVDLKNQHNVSRNNSLNVNGYIRFSPTPELSFISRVGFMHNNGAAERFFNSKTSAGSPRNLSSLNGINGSIRENKLANFSNENTVTWTKNVGTHHNIKGLGLFSLSHRQTNVHGFSSRLLPNEVLGMDGLDEGIPYNPVFSSSENSMVSYASRWDYNYRSKYLLTVNFRADGSSKFTQPWGYFPGAAVAWNMTQERFFANAFPSVSNSKLRASYGSTGNNRIGDFQRFASLLQNLNGYSFGNDLPVGSVYVNNMANEDLKWEKVTTVDIGYELGLFKNRISMEVDLYRRITDDLLLQATLPPTTGFTSAMKNIGALKNEGLEITLNTINIRNKSFSWNSNFNISFNRNTIIKLTEGERALSTVAAFFSQYNTRPSYMSEINKSAGMMVGYIWDGNYQFEDFHNPSPGVYVLKDEVPDNGSGRAVIMPGDIKYRDLNGDGRINDMDITYIGNGRPIHTGGLSNNLSYKGFDLNVFFQWSYGNDLLNADRIIFGGNAGKTAHLNQYASYADRWTPENPTNQNYRSGGQGPIGVFSSRTIEDGSYLRLKTVSLAYSLPANWTRSLYMSKLSLRVTAQNLWRWTNYSGIDPEVSTRNPILSPGFDFSAYPQAKTIVFGLNAEF